MATQKNNKSITNLFGTIAAAQTMNEQFPFSFGMDEKGFTCTFDLLTTIFNLISDEPIQEKIINEISDRIADEKGAWLQNIETIVKSAIELNLTNLLTCEMSPIIPDRLIGSGEFLKNTDRKLNFQGDGVTIPLSAIDITGMLRNCPADVNNPATSVNFFPCYKSGTDIPLSVDELWKHDDFNAFLWYVKNKGIYGNLTERHKLIWDNRYKTKLGSKTERKPEHFFTMSRGYDAEFDAIPKEEGVFPFSASYLESYNAKVPYKKRQILECRYIEGDGIKSDSFQFRLPATNYYKTRKLTTQDENSKLLAINKTIFEFNHDFLMSIKLFDAKTYLCQVIDNVLGVGNISLNFSLEKEQDECNAMIDSIIEKVINISDIEIDDCYYTFSNDEYNQMLQNAFNKRIKKDNNITLSENLIRDIMSLGETNSTFHENKTVITNTLTQLTRETEKQMNKPNNWRFNSNLEFELIRMFVYPLIRPLFSPKVMTLILINLEVMGNPLKIGEKVITFEDLKPYLMNIITNIVVQIKDIINEMIYSWVIEKLTPLFSMFTLRVLMEQIEMYRSLISDLLTACTMGGFNNKRRVGIDKVDYVDINPELEKLKQTSISTTNC